MSGKASSGSDADPYKGEREGKLREVGNQAVWSLSSCKPGNHSNGAGFLNDTKFLSSLEIPLLSSGAPCCPVVPPVVQ